MSRVTDNAKCKTLVTVAIVGFSNNMAFNVPVGAVECGENHY